MAQLHVVTQGDKGGGHRPSGDKGNSQMPRVGPMQSSVQRIARPPEARKDPSRRAEQPAGSRVTRFNAPAPETPTASPFQQDSWLRTLVIGLILIALVPNITLAAVLWLGLIDPPWSQQETPPPAETQTATPPAVLTAPATLEATAGETISFPIALDGTDGVPARSVIAIAGLPRGSTFSDGRPYGETEWNLKSDQIGDLHLTVPVTASGESRVAISLITTDDKVLADTETVLKVTPAPLEPGAQAPNAEAGAGAGGALVTAPTATPDAIEADGAAAEEGASPGTAAGPSDDTAPSATSDATGKDEKPPSFVQPSAYVNLRDGPSSSSRVVGVIAKGAKVEVLERKRGWLQVTNPATSEKGWIYSGYVDGGVKPRPRTKRSAKQEPEQKSESSFWGWLIQ
ncbi:MAG: SH3 domain-containing protein [Methyloceanibacter sp.]